MTDDTGHHLVAQAKSFDAWRDFPTADDPETWELSLPGEEPRTINLKDGNLRVFKALVQGPIYCASRVRISDRVLILKRNHGVNVETHMFDAQPGSDCDRFGIYELKDQARRVIDEVAA